MLKKKILGIITLLTLTTLLTACAAKPAISVHENALIFTAKYAEEMRISDLYKATDFWTPSTEEINLLEEEIAAYLQENADFFYNQPYPWERLEKYQRQYVGYEDEGRKMIFGNYFCGAGNLDWEVDFIEVMDGGECFFHVRYDLESGKFTELRVNGES